MNLIFNVMEDTTKRLTAREALEISNAASYVDSALEEIKKAAEIGKRKINVNITENDAEELIELGYEVKKRYSCSIGLTAYEISW